MAPELLTPSPNRAQTQKKPAESALELKILLPLITTSSPAKRAFVLRSVTAEPASGSDMAAVIIVFPARRGGRTSFFSSSEPKNATCWMAPKFPAWKTSPLLGQTMVICSMARTASMRVPPPPPSSWGILSPSIPFLARTLAFSHGYSPRFSQVNALALKCFSARSLAIFCTIFCS